MVKHLRCLIRVPVRKRHLKREEKFYTHTNSTQTAFLRAFDALPKFLCRGSDLHNEHQTTQQKKTVKFVLFICFFVCKKCTRLPGRLQSAPPLQSSTILTRTNKTIVHRHTPPHTHDHPYTITQSRKAGKER